MAEAVSEVKIIVDVDGRRVPLAIKKMTRDIAREGELSGREFGDSFGEEVEKSIRTKLEGGLKNALVTKDFDNFTKGFKDVDEAVKTARKSLNGLNDSNQITLEQYRKWTKVLDDWKAGFDVSETLKEQKTLWAEYTRQQNDDWAKIQKAQGAASRQAIADEKELWKTRNTTHSAYVKFAAEEDRVASVAAKVKAIEDQARAYKTYGENLDHTAGTVTIFGRRIENLNDKVKKFDLGELFGKGSRNNFLNAVGSAISLVDKLSDAIIGGLANNAADAVKGFGKAFTAAFSQLFSGGGFGGFGEVFGGIKQTLAGLSQAFTAILPSVSSLGVALVAVEVIAGLVVSALSLLSGAVVALASSLTYGVIGALLAAAPAALALGAAIGVVVVGIKNMSDAQKAAFKPLQTAWNDLSKTVASNLFANLPAQVASMTQLLKTFVGPTMTGIATELSQSWTKALDIFNSPALQKPLKTLSDGLTNIAGSLGDAFAKALPAVIAFFQPIMPYAEKFAQALDDIATNFLAWSTSAEGQNGIAEFMDKAWSAATKLWGILKNVAGIIGTVFSGGVESGNDFLQSIQDVTGQFNDFLKSPEGQKQLQQWFEDAKKFADNLATSIGQISAAILALDTPNNRDAVTSIAGALGTIGDAISAFDKQSGGQGPGYEAGAALRKNIQDTWIPAIKDFASAAAKWFSEAWDSAKTFVTNVGKTIGDWISGLPEKGGALVDAVEEWFSGAVDGVVTAVRSWNDAISDWVDALPAKGKNLAVSIGKWFTDAGTAIGAAVASWWSDQLLPFLNDLPNQMLYALGQGVGWLVAFFVNSYNAMITWWNGTVVPWFTGIPGQVSDGVNTSKTVLVDWFTSMWNGTLAWWGQTVIPWVTSIPGQIGSAISNGYNAIVAWFQTAWNQVTSWVSGTMLPFISSLPGQIGNAISNGYDAIAAWFRNAWNGVTGWWNGVAYPWVSGLPGRIASAFGGYSSALVDFFSRMWGGVTSWWSGTAMPWISGLPGRIAGAFGGIGSAIGDGISSTLRGVVNRIIDGINSFIAGYNSQPLLPDIGYLSHFARGGILRGPQVIIAGEAGDEAVVPLRRPLSQVDPSVRDLSAIAQGLVPAPASSGINISPGAIVVNTPLTNPVRVAEAVLDRIALATI